MSLKIVFSVMIAAGTLVWLSVSDEAIEKPRTRITDASASSKDEAAVSIVYETALSTSGSETPNSHSVVEHPVYPTLEEARWRLGELNREIRQNGGEPTARELEELRHLRQELRRLKNLAASAGTGEPETVDLWELRGRWEQEHPLPDMPAAIQ